ncbi:MAG: hypothetical protein LBM38_00420 [Clostridiales bacterium]|jgi:hypothetical protein|nr:hypothetical protein [Clostridiales bacterium]
MTKISKLKIYSIMQWSIFILLIVITIIPFCVDKSIITLPAKFYTNYDIQDKLNIYGTLFQVMSTIAVLAPSVLALVSSINDKKFYGMSVAKYVYSYKNIVPFRRAIMLSVMLVLVLASWFCLEFQYFNTMAYIFFLLVIANIYLIKDTLEILGAEEKIKGEIRDYMIKKTIQRSKNHSLETGEFFVDMLNDAIESKEPKEISEALFLVEQLYLISNYKKIYLNEDHDIISKTIDLIEFVNLDYEFNGHILHTALEAIFENLDRRKKLTASTAYISYDLHNSITQNKLINQKQKNDLLKHVLDESHYLWINEEKDYSKVNYKPHTFMPILPKTKYEIKEFNYFYYIIECIKNNDKNLIKSIYGYNQFERDLNNRSLYNNNYIDINLTNIFLIIYAYYFGYYTTDASIIGNTTTFYKNIIDNIIANSNLKDKLEKALNDGDFKEKAVKYLLFLFDEFDVREYNKDKVITEVNQNCEFVEECFVYFYTLNLDEEKLKEILSEFKYLIHYDIYCDNEFKERFNTFAKLYNKNDEEQNKFNDKKLEILQKIARELYPQSSGWY